MKEFDLVNGNNNKTYIKINSNITNIELLRKTFESNRINHLVISRNITDLTFCEGLKDIIEVFVSVDRPNCNYKPVEQLYRLKHLFVENFEGQHFDFSQLTELQYLNVHWQNKLIGLENLAALKHLEIRAMKEKDLSKILFPASLKKLEIVSSKIESLRGIELALNLECLGIHYLSKLTSLEGIQYCLNLCELTVINCLHIGSLRELSNLPMQKIIIENGGVIDTINYLKNIKELENVRLINNTVIEDGEVSFLRNLPNYFVEPKKHYF